MIARFGLFTLDVRQRRLARVGKELHLTPKAFDLLSLLIDDAPYVVPKSELHARLWPDTFVSDATLVSLVKELRRTLDDRDSLQPLIRTVIRVGYAFAAPVEKEGARSPGTRHWLVVGGRRIVLSEGENILGRDPAAEVWIDSPGVSRRHATIRVDGGSATVDDLASKNGTHLNDRPLSGPVPLHDGDCLQIGPVVVVFHESPLGVPTETTVIGKSPRGSVSGV